MPEVYFEIQWPDGERARLYSPSSIVRDYFEAGETLSLKDFLSRSEAAFRIADQRVRAKFGFRCSGAAASLASIRQCASAFCDEDLIQVVSIENP